MLETHDSGIATVLSELGAVPPPGTVQDLNALHISHGPLDIYRAYLVEVLTSISGCDAHVALQSIQLPGTLANGDLDVPVPRLRINGSEKNKNKNKKPGDLAAELAASFADNHPLFHKPVASGIHLPIFFTAHSLSRILLPCIFHRRHLYGSIPLLGLGEVTGAALSPGPKKVVVEFSSPNIAKEFHAGHLRSTIIGAYISNLYKSMGWNVVKINYLGDWGKQFGLLAIGWQRYGSEDKLAREPLKHLLDVYAQINSDFKPEQEASKKARDEGRDTADIESKGLYAERNNFFGRMEAGDPSALALWKRFRDISVERYISTYARLNIDFDVYSGESQVQTTTIQYVEHLLRDRGIYEESDGSWLINFEKHGGKGLGVAIIRGRTGTTTYLLRDVAGILEREKEYNFDKMIYVVSSEQNMYFRRVFQTVELIGRPNLARRLQHVNFGKVLGMSSRLGNVQLLSDILDQSAEVMHEVMHRNEARYAQLEDPKATAEAVSISAVMVQDMMGKRINNYPFDMNRMASFEGDTGPYLQYCHARLNSILRRADLTRDDLVNHITENPGALDADLESNPHALDLLRLMSQYPDVTTHALRTLEPATVLTYLFRLTHQLSSCYHVLQVVDADEAKETMIARASLYEAARQILENGMRLLGLSPVDRYVFKFGELR